MKTLNRDIAVYVALAVVSALCFWDSLSLPAGVYDPLGAGTLPRIVTVGIVLLSAIALFQGWLKTRKQTSGESEPGEVEDLRPGLAAIIFGYAVLFGILIAFRIPFLISTFAFLLASSLSITGFSRSKVIAAVLFAGIMAACVTYLFGSVFRVDLP